MPLLTNRSFVAKINFLAIALVVQIISASGQNCEVNFPGTATRSFSTSCGSSADNLELGESVHMDNGDTFTFNISTNIDGNVSVESRGGGKIIIPAGVTVTVDGNFQLDREHSGCTTSNPCIFEIVVNGTLIISQNLQNNLVTVVWSGTGTVVIDDKLENSSSGCMACGTGGCPDFEVESGCSDDGNNCSNGDFCDAITNTCSPDTEKPKIIGCPTNIITNITSGCALSVSWTPPTATDNCTSTPPTPNYQPGTSFPKGIHTVTYTARDGSGNTQTCSFTVTVNDGVNPDILNCQPSVVITSYDPVRQTGVAVWEVPVATDNCTSVILTSSANPGDNFDKGITVVTYTATDASGNIRTCDFEVNMKEGNSEIQLEVFKAVSPNSDGLNDVWFIKGIEEYPDNKVTVFDRWGREVFGGKGYNNKSVVWDGLTGGKVLPAGTYFYAIEINNKASVLRGSLELVN